MDRGAVVKARRMYAHLHRFFKWAYGREIIFTNPMTGLEKPGTEKARDRVLGGSELIQVWNACEGPFGAAVRLLILTGARVTEISALKWTEVDGDTISLDADRMKAGKAHTIALSAPARNLIEAMPRTGEFVFSVDGGKSPIRRMDARPKERIDQVVKLAPWRLHDLRRSVSTGMNELGVEPHVVEAVLGHTVKGVAGVYNRAKHELAKRSAIEVWAAHVMALIEGKAPGKVLPMRGKR
jgi:integrase